MNKSKIKLTKLDILLGLLLIVIIFLIILLFSYAHFQVQTVENLTASTVQGDFECLDISFNEKGTINLNKNYPVTDDYALANFTPIEATVVNNCSTNKVDYVLSLSSIYLKSSNYDTSYIPDNKIRVKITKEVGASTANNLVNTDYLSNMSILDNNSNSYKYISNFYKTDSNYTNYNLKNTYKVDSSSIGANTTIKYKIYLWIDYYEGAPVESKNNNYNNSTQGLKFSVSSAITLNVKDDSDNQLLSSYLIENYEGFDLWQSGLEGDGYRFIGSGSVGESYNPNNFVCFGTNDLEECITDMKYLYRIIGIFPDENGDQHVKLISAYEQFETGWDDDAYSDISWENSKLYKNLNGDGFLTNTEYMKDSTWINKISMWKWSAVNTLTDEEGGPDYYNTLTPTEIYFHEMNKSENAYSIGEWTTPKAKVGLMYVSDYLLSLGDESLNVTSGTYDNQNLFLTSWLSYANNFGLSVEGWVGTMARLGISKGDNNKNHNKIYLIEPSGYIANWNQASKSSEIHPVFYLSSNVNYYSGSGTPDDPFIISE